MDAMHAMDIVLRAYPGNVILGATGSDAGFVFGLGTPEEKYSPPIPGGLPVAVDRNDGRIIGLLPGSEEFYRFLTGARRIYPNGPEHGQTGAS